MNDQDLNRAEGRDLCGADGDDDRGGLPVRPVRKANGRTPLTDTTHCARSRGGTNPARVRGLRTDGAVTEAGRYADRKRYRKYNSNADPLRRASIEYDRRQDPKRLVIVEPYRDTIEELAASSELTSDEVMVRVVQEIPVEVRRAAFGLPRRQDPLWKIGQRLIREYGALDLTTVGMLYGVTRQRIEQIEVSTKPIVRRGLSDFASHVLNAERHALEDS